MFVLIKSQTSSKLCHVGLKPRSLGQILEKLVYAVEATFSTRTSGNLVRMSVSMKSWMTLKMGHGRSKTRSLGRILEKPCVHSRDHIFSLIIMKLGQNVCLSEILNELENGSHRFKN